jgi:RHS repeat-associated protein
VAYLDEGNLDESGLSEPVSVGGRVVGPVRGGAFQAVGTDLRGTVLAEANLTPRVASPFGQRDVRPAVAAAIDYVQKGYDADLKLARMGVRDYDPEINRFTTPDPLYLERRIHSKSSKSLMPE